MEKKENKMKKWLKENETTVNAVCAGIGLVTIGYLLGRTDAAFKVGKVSKKLLSERGDLLQDITKQIGDFNTMKSEGVVDAETLEDAYALIHGNLGSAFTCGKLVEYYEDAVNKI